MKNELRGRKFEADEDVMEAVDDFLEEQDAEWYRRGLQKLEQRWTKCIDVRGDYVEK